MLIRAQSSDSGPGRISVRIPNFEIKSQFRKWIRTDLERSMAKAGLEYGPSVSLFRDSLFRDMVDGYFSEFSKAFGEFILTSMPQRIFGSHVPGLGPCILLRCCGRNTRQAVDNQNGEVAGDGRADIILHDDEKGTFSSLNVFCIRKNRGIVIRRSYCSPRRRTRLWTSVIRITIVVLCLRA